MHTPDITYRYTYPKDIASPTMEIMSRAGSVIDNAASITVPVTGVPSDRILVLSNIVIQATPGALESVRDLQIFATTQAGLNFVLAWRELVAVVDQKQTLNWAGEVWVQGRGIENTVVGCFGEFSGAHAGNSVSFGLQGIVIPRGNVAAF